MFASTTLDDAAGAPAAGTARSASGDALKRATRSFALAIEALPQVDRSEVFGLISRLRDQLNAAEAKIAADQLDDGYDDQRASRGLKQKFTGAGDSKREAAKKAQRAAAVAKKPELGDRLSDGDLSTQHVDLLARAAAQTDDAALKDEALIDSVAERPPDQAAAIIRDWVNEHNRDDAEAEYSRQRRLADVRRFVDKDNVDCALVRGDRPSMDVFWAELNREADKLYKKDGGRDVAGAEHPRTHGQRLFDAFISAFTGEAKTGSGAKPVVFVGTTIDQLVDDKASSADLVGSGPLPDSVFEEILSRANVVAQIFSGAGDLLWQGRSRRDPTTRQYIALVSRDKGCVLCRAPVDRCVVHHTIPVTSPLKGETDIDKMCLLCEQCHRQLHGQNRTIYRDVGADGKFIWKTRPATPAETPYARGAPAAGKRKRSGRQRSTSKHGSRKQDVRRPG